MKDAMSRLKLDEVCILSYSYFYRQIKTFSIQLPDHLFEELAKDIYDEMDRRQIESSNQDWTLEVQKFNF